jgi:hypothetical protein
MSPVCVPSGCWLDRMLAGRANPFYGSAQLWASPKAHRELVTVHILPSWAYRVVATCCRSTPSRSWMVRLGYATRAAIVGPMR